MISYPSHKYMQVPNGYMKHAVGASRRLIHEQNQGHPHITDLAKGIKALEDSEETSLNRIATANSCFDSMEEEELRGWSDEAQKYIADINNHIEVLFFENVKRTTQLENNTVSNTSTTTPSF
jgi:hypothetical protein